MLKSTANLGLGKFAKTVVTMIRPNAIVPINISVLTIKQANLITRNTGLGSMLIQQNSGGFLYSHYSW